MMVPLSPVEHFTAAAAVFRGTVLEVGSYRDPSDQLIYTRALIKVEESLKSTIPTVVQVIHRGGEVDGHGEQDGLNQIGRAHV